MNDKNLRIGGKCLYDCRILPYFVCVSVYWGCCFRLFGNLAMMPFAVRIKTWDIVALESFFSVIDLTKIIQLSL